MVKPPPSDLIGKIKSEKHIDSIVNKGAPVKEDAKQEDKKVKEEKWKLVPIRMPEKLIRELDDKIEKRLGLSRNAWILEAIQEKINRKNNE